MKNFKPSSGVVSKETFNNNNNDDLKKNLSDIYNNEEANPSCKPVKLTPSQFHRMRQFVHEKFGKNKPAKISNDNKSSTPFTKSNRENINSKMEESVKDSEKKQPYYHGSRLTDLSQSIDRKSHSNIIPGQQEKHKSEGLNEHLDRPNLMNNSDDYIDESHKSIKMNEGCKTPNSPIAKNKKEEEEEEFEVNIMDGFVKKYIIDENFECFGTQYNPLIYIINSFEIRNQDQLKVLTKAKFDYFFYKEFSFILIKNKPHYSTFLKQYQDKISAHKTFFLFELTSLYN